MTDFTKPTAELYSKFIERPKMTEKLLAKPPFKYLFDIIMETIKKSGFASGLYNAEEQNAEFHSDRDKKIAYLAKIIRVVQLMSGTPVQVKPQKIVAGMDAELTNIFLQQMYVCATSKKDSQPYVNKVLGKETVQPEKKEAEKKESSKVIRPPSAARIKKPIQQPKGKRQEREEQQQSPPPPPPVVEEKPVRNQPKKSAQISQKQAQYSQNIKKIKAEAQNEMANQKQVQNQESKAKNQISLGKLGGKKKKDNSQKLISSGGELTDKQLQLVQNMIQSICQNTAPLGKSIQFINDDIEAMNKQLSFWRKQYNASKAKTQNQLKITEQALLPVYDKIHEIEQQILDQKSKIQTAKAQILKNDSIIKDLLMSVVTTK